MAFNPPTFAADEEVTSTKMNQIRDSLNWLKQRLAPFYKSGSAATWVGHDNLGFFIINADIAPGNASGSGDNGLTWTRFSGGQGASFMVVQFNIPSYVFTTNASFAKPLIVGLTVGAGEPPLGYPWLVPTARYDESTTGFKQRFGMTNNPPTELGSGHFNVSGLVVGPWKTTPT